MSRISRDRDGTRYGIPFEQWRAMSYCAKKVMLREMKRHMSSPRYSGEKYGEEYRKRRFRGIETAIRFLERARRQGSIDDLRKAHWYVNRAIARYELAAMQTKKRRAA